MAARELVVDRITAIGPHRVAVHIRPGPGLDLQHVYRAAMSVYWNPALSRLEDTCEGERSAVASFVRIAKALEDEPGFRLRPAEGLVWDGVADEDQKAILAVWSGQA
jgi:hypothetical protein